MNDLELAEARRLLRRFIKREREGAKFGYTILPRDHPEYGQYEPEWSRAAPDSYKLVRDAEKFLERTKP